MSSFGVGGYTPAMLPRSTLPARFVPRRTHRFPANLPLCFFNEAYVGQGRVTDLSLKGCAVVGNQIVKRGDTLTFHAPYAGDAPLLAGSCAVVRWVLGHEFGAEIVQAQPKAQRRLREWVKLMATKR
jgi:hypothetical protein